MSVSTYRRKPLEIFDCQCRDAGGTNDNLGRSPNVAYHIEHLHRSPRGLVDAVE